MEIYEVNSNSWRVLDSDNPDFQINRDGISLKGNTYWLASSNEEDEETVDCFLISFDFTMERFGSPICLPITGCFHTFSLSSVREEELSVLFQHEEESTLEIWITNNITETNNALSWSKFFKIDINGFQRLWNDVYFFIGEENKVAVCCDDVAGGGFNTILFGGVANIVYIIGEDRWTEKDLGGEYGRCQRMFRYVPSLVQI
ncbi:unnamed protein product [Microthlaspi erraticum]|uniref:F-box associated beta-propeller type 1 domain-containing protein n=1 Tax=Microthlaspi erraticum TaxID=1685480 RepID=A0A6D2KH88_9BRAS|nr:unnamed protein product [Microthlaspi erraticum]